MLANEALTDGSDEDNSVDETPLLSIVPSSQKDIEHTQIDSSHTRTQNSRMSMQHNGMFVIKKMMPAQVLSQPLNIQDFS
jgi:hypothetical protein